MASKFCPDCGGSGLVAKHFFAMPCSLCKANDLGNYHLGPDTLKIRGYMDSWMVGESSPMYWAWLKYMITNGHINPDSPKPQLKQSAKTKVQ